MLSPLIWTRSVADWDDDALLLPHHVRKVIHLPCLAIKPLQPQLPDGDYPYVVATSANAIVALERLPHGRKKFAQAMFLCFGPKTREKAEACGYRTWRLPASLTSAQQLAEHLLQELPPATRIAVLSALQPAFALDKALAARFRVTTLVLYETHNHVAWPSGEAISGEQKQNLAAGRHVICFASPATVEGFYQTFRQNHAEWRENFHAFAIGATTATATQQYFKHYSTSSTQTLATLAREATALLF